MTRPASHREQEHSQFPKLLSQAVKDILKRTGDFHGTLETFGDGTIILTLKSLR